MAQATHPRHSGDGLAAVTANGSGAGRDRPGRSAGNRIRGRGGASARRRRLFRLAAAAVGVIGIGAALCALAPAPAAAESAAVALYAAPYGSGTPGVCAQEDPCDLTTALATTGTATVVLMPDSPDGSDALFTTESGWDVVAADLTVMPLPGVTATLDGRDRAPSILRVTRGSTLHISDLTVSGSSVNATGEAEAVGGGIYNDHGTVEVSDSVFSMNVTAASGFSGSKAYGGGIFNDRGTVTVTGSTFESNWTNASGSSTASGGGIDNDGGSVVVERSTFEGNETTRSVNGTATGGGLNNRGLDAAVVNSTFVENGAAALSNAGGSVALAGDLLVGTPEGTACEGDGFTDRGYNVVADASCGLTTPTSTVTDRDALQLKGDEGGAALSGDGLAAWLGGPTPAVLPGAGSAAVGVIPAGTRLSGLSFDGSDIVLCAESGDVTGATDQRGVPRPVVTGARCSAGAVEPALPDAVAGSEYEALLPTLTPDASAGSEEIFGPSRALRAEEVSGLPDGLSFDRQSSTLNGAPLSEGAFVLTARYGDDSDPLPQASRDYRFTLLVSPLAEDGSGAGGHGGATGGDRDGSGPSPADPGGSGSEGTDPGHTGPGGSGGGTAGHGVADAGTAEDFEAADTFCSDGPFADVSAGGRFCGAIGWAKDRGIIAGYSDGTFRPSASLTRAAAAAFLYRDAHYGSSAPGCVVAPYRDVRVGDPFCGEIAWLQDHGIASGYRDGTFRSGAPLSRAAAAAFLHRSQAGGDAAPSCSRTPFTDVPVSGPFCAQIAWLKGNRVTTGYADGDFRPNRSVSREAFTVFLRRIHP